MGSTQWQIFNAAFLYIWKFGNMEMYCLHPKCSCDYDNLHLIVRSKLIIMRYCHNSQFIETQYPISIFNRMLFLLYQNSEMALKNSMKYKFQVMNGSKCQNRKMKKMYYHSKLKCNITLQQYITHGFILLAVAMVSLWKSSEEEQHF